MASRSVGLSLLMAMNRRTRVATPESSSARSRPDMDLVGRGKKYLSGLPVRRAISFRTGVDGRACPCSTWCMNVLETSLPASSPKLRPAFSRAWRTRSGSTNIPDPRTPRRTVRRIVIAGTCLGRKQSSLNGLAALRKHRCPILSANGLTRCRLRQPRLAVSSAVEPAPGSQASVQSAIVDCSS